MDSTPVADMIGMKLLLKARTDVFSFDNYQVDPFYLFERIYIFQSFQLVWNMQPTDDNIYINKHDSQYVMLGCSYVWANSFQISSANKGYLICMNH